MRLNYKQFNCSFEKKKKTCGHRRKPTSFSYKPSYTCQLSPIIWESPEYRENFPVFRTGDKISQIKVNWINSTHTHKKKNVLNHIFSKNLNHPVSYVCILGFLASFIFMHASCTSLLLLCKQQSDWMSLQPI